MAKTLVPATAANGTARLGAATRDLRYGPKAGAIVPRPVCSRCTPLLLAGDEFARPQNGNDNAYRQDNEISWVDWDIREEGQSLIRFVRKLTRLRHKYSILRRGRFLTGVYNKELGIKRCTLD